MSKENEIVEETEASTEVEGTESEQLGGYEEPDYGAIVADDDEVEIVAETEEPPAEPLEAAPPVEEAVEGTASTEPPSAPEPVAAAEPPATDELTDEQFKEQMETYRNETMGQLVEQYKFSPEEAASIDELDSRPSEYLPKLMAQAHYNAYMSIWSAVSQSIPSFVEKTLTTQNQRAELRNQFFSRWEALKGHEDVAARAIQTYRAMNPKASLEEVIERSGALAMATLGQVAQPAAQPRQMADTTPPPPPLNPGGGAVAPSNRTQSYEEEVFARMVEDEF